MSNLLKLIVCKHKVVRTLKIYGDEINHASVSHVMRHKTTCLLCGSRKYSL